MANASGAISLASVSVRSEKSSAASISPSGFFSLYRNPRRMLSLRCDATVECSSRSKSRLPRLVGMGSKLVGCGSALPKLQISNDDLAKIVETSDEWISVRTGIRNRRVLSDIVELASDAAKGALSMAQVSPDDVDLILMCTSTPENLFGDAARVQRELGCKNALSFDITAACSGFVVGLVTGSRFIKGGGYQNVLVIGSDALSQYVDWSDRGTCILFGDAAGAVLLQACSEKEDGFLGFDLQSDGMVKTPRRQQRRPRLPPRKPSYSCLKMNGKEVFRFAVRCVPQSIEAALDEAGLPSSTIDWLLLHQANQRIIDSVANRLQIPSHKIISNLASYGNTSAASIPLALDEAVRGGQVKAGDVIAMSGFGAGLTWGSIIVRWG
ncbi:unnamed protein product [Spirodela intermedia]|uniref:beta-ketoacyl-[acyl-carrier-protein] synthase III n=1 Tax=Spirodela intermedia TaxID=51605 RepID=A0A7I8IEM8_SPIIN|nr:unnamed protein product [Spirodela intermedia]CAA6655553.1 unnamed protein product [Spirodela intermedia]